MKNMTKKVVVALIIAVVSYTAINEPAVAKTLSTAGQRGKVVSNTLNLADFVIWKKVAQDERESTLPGITPEGADDTEDEAEGVDATEKPVLIPVIILENAEAETLEGEPSGLVAEDAELPEEGEPLAEETELPEDGPAPYVDVFCAYQGEMAPGTEVTVYAVVYNVDASQNIGYQWFNNANGSFQPVEGATQSSYTFIADESTTNCIWQASISIE